MERADMLIVKRRRERQRQKEGRTKVTVKEISVSRTFRSFGSKKLTPKV